MSGQDELPELIAQRVEELSLLDIRGIGAKRKRDREDAEVRRKARIEQRSELADLIRFMKSSRRYDAIAILADLAEQSERERSMALVDAWPLASKGWLNIYCTIKCNSNCLPPKTEYRIELTDHGREVLASRRIADGETAENDELIEKT